MSGARVAALFVHPIKSAAAIAVDSLDLDARGAIGDRRWMLVDGDGTAVTAREVHRVALLRPSFATADRDGALCLDAPGMPRHTVDVPQRARSYTVRIWEDEVAAQDTGDAVADWCSAAVGEPCRLVRLADAARRPLQAKYAGALPYDGREVALTDGAPLLLLGQASIDALNVRLLDQGKEPVSYDRFRPNVLLSGTALHEEDTWREIVIGALTLGVGSPCPRCVMTTVNPKSAEAGTEPLRTLSGYRRAAGGVMFGVNATHATPGSISAGDPVTVRTLRES